MVKAARAVKIFWESKVQGQQLFYLQPSPRANVKRAFSLSPTASIALASSARHKAEAISGPVWAGSAGDLGRFRSGPVQWFRRDSAKVLQNSVAVPRGSVPGRRCR